VAYKTDEEVEKVTHLALEESGGKQSIAAAKLGIPLDTLILRVKRNKALNARWGSGKKVPVPPTEAVTINRPVIPPADVATAEALGRENAAVRDLEGMGLTDAGLKLALVCQNFHRRFFRNALEGMSGGVYRQFMRVMEEIDKIDQRLDTTDMPLPLPEEIMLREDRSRLLVIMGQFKDKVDKSVLIQAQVDRMRKDKDKVANYKPKGVLDLESAAT